MDLPAVAALAALAGVFILIAVRNVGGLRIGIWAAMLGGAAVALLAGAISPVDALRAVNLDVMAFLAGMFVVGAVLEESGYLSHVARRVFRHAATPGQLLLLVLVAVGVLSAFLMNDTLAIVGTPVMLGLGARHRISGKALLLALAFAVTIGSVMSPIGNPQNLLVAVEGGVGNPFVVFAVYLAVPTFVNLLAAFALIKLYYPEEFARRRLGREADSLGDGRLVLAAKVSATLLVAMVGLKIVLATTGSAHDFGLVWIAIVPAVPALLLAPRPLDVARRVDWRTLVFFASMFVLTAAVWETGVFQRAVGGAASSVGAIMGLGILLSQLISNVPFVALYLPLLDSPETVRLMALAAGSTIAGNLPILGAASNVIVIQNAEARGETLTFWEFVRIGAPLTAINLAVYWAYLTFMAMLF